MHIWQNIYLVKINLDYQYMHICFGGMFEILHNQINKEYWIQV